MTYETWKMIHYFGVVIFLGNMIITGIWKYFADRHGEPRTVAFAQRLIILTDIIFTLPGAALITVSGLMMVMKVPALFNQLWLQIGVGLFGASAVLWAAVLIPLQIKMYRMSLGFAQGGEIPERYWLLNKYWFIAGWTVTAFPMLNVFFMTMKPQ